MKRLGEWVRANEHGPRIILASDRRPCFYAGPACGRIVRLHEIKPPIREEAAFENFLRSQKIDFVVTDTRYIHKFFPAYDFLVETPPGYLQKAAEEEAGGYRAVLYRYSPGSRIP